MSAQMTPRRPDRGRRLDFGAEKKTAPRQKKVVDSDDADRERRRKFVRGNLEKMKKFVAEELAATKWKFGDSRFKRQ